MSFKAILYAYVLGGLTFIPLLLACLVLFTVYTSVPVGELDVAKRRRNSLEAETQDDNVTPEPAAPTPNDVNDLPKTRKGWLTMRRTFEESQFDGGYVTLVRSFLDARSKDPKRSRPKDMWYVVLKGKILYLYEDEGMTECEAAIQLGFHDVVIYPEGLQDGELFAKRNAITKEMKLEGELEKEAESESVKRKVAEAENAAREEAFDSNTPWFIFVRSNVEMEDWYLSLVHASDHPAQTPTLTPLASVFQPADMNNLVSTLDEQPDVIPMRWLNALLGRIFYSFYRTDQLESFIIGRLMKKLSKVKRPTFLTDIVVTEVSVGNTTPTFSKPMLKELTKEGDASLEIHVLYKGEIRITVEATANISIGTFKSYNVKLVLAAVLKEMEGNLLVKVKRPPSNRIWYAFTQTPRMVLEVEPIVSDRQITWSMILGTLESRLKEIIQESIVMPNMDDIAFFESLEYDHRGGIWSGAARRERQQPAIASSLSAPSEAQSRTNRRRTWFSTVRGDEFKSLPEEVEQERGRSVDIEKPEAVQRSHSTPSKPESISDGSSSNGDSPSTSTRPPPPQISLSADGSSRSSSQSSERVPSTAKPIPEPSSPSPSVKETLRVNPPSSPTSSFLSTLKSKAGDKQALSNSAKEAMRKWGWGGLKKDEDKEAVPDHGAVGNNARQRIDSFTHRARSSYADVRAAVESRRREDSEALSPSEDVRRRTEEEVKEAPAPIKMQPQAKTMSIPGIHASHKGDVMSMGYVAPAPVQPAASPPKNPFNRLWKSPASGPQENTEVAGTEEVSDPNAGRPVPPIPSARPVPPPPSAAQRPVPPPLPPRVAVARPPLEHARVASDTSSQSASESLKSIARRSISTPNPPPLPEPAPVASN
ncbi:putative integral membrane protein conserved region-domain-containing protein [Mucidula mucida]|nr:putative integral membrane protein conserved region-domain-containing protein [Mucidula mucida]